MSNATPNTDRAAAASRFANLWRTKFAPATEHNGIQMKRIGGWQDLAGYYSGSDGNAWTCRAPGAFYGSSSNWRNEGPLIPFVDRLAAGKLRGALE